MKKGFWRLLSVCVCACVMLSAMPLAAVQANERLLVSAFAASITQDMIDTLRSGGKISTQSTPTVSASSSPFSLKKASTLPSSFDLRAQGYTTEVGDQLISGPCWSFAATASMESIALQRDASTNYSEKHLAYFSYALPDQQAAYSWFLSDTDSSSVYEMGGFTLTPTYTLSNWIGPVSEEEYPYDGTFDALPEEAAQESEAHLTDALFLPTISRGESDEQEQIEALTAQAKQLMLEYNCALSIGYYASDMSQDYNASTYAWFNDTAEGFDHGVTIVGWDDNYSKSNFKHSSEIQNDGAWLVKNSWGSDWGDNGYFWLSYEDHSLVIEGCYLFETTDNYDSLYSYDASVYLEAIGFNSDGTVDMANIFTANSNEELEAVSFYTADMNTAYTVKIYTGLTNANNPQSGKLVATISGTEAYWGYHTVSLPSAVSLTKGSRFSVVVSLQNPDTLYTTYMEAMLTTDKDATSSISSARQSFLKISTSWVDVHDATLDLGSSYYLVMGNFPIKAFTSSENHVVFSEESGEIAFGSTVSLRASGGGEVYYTTDGSDPTVNGTLYTTPLTIDREMTVKAAVKQNGTFARVTEKTYTQAHAQLTTLLVKSGKTTSYWSLDSEDALSCASSAVSAVATTAGSLTVEGTATASSTTFTPLWTSNEYSDEPFSHTVITVEQDGCLPTTYTLRLTKNGVDYDFENEQVLLSEAVLDQVTDSKGETVSSGQSVTDWLDGDGMTFQINGKSIVLPARAEAPTLTDDGILLSADGFSLPYDPQAEHPLEYRLGEDGDWVSEPTFTGLDAGGTYTVYARYRACDANGFASKAASLTLSLSDDAPTAITSTQYIIDNGVIAGLEVGTTVEQLKNGTGESAFLVVLDGEQESSGTLKTGMILRLVVNGETVEELIVAVTGDLNGDGAMNATDARTMLMVILNGGCTTAQQTAGDLNGDGGLTTTDVRLLLSEIVASA